MKKLILIFVSIFLLSACSKQEESFVDAIEKISKNMESIESKEESESETEIETLVEKDLSTETIEETIEETKVQYKGRITIDPGHQREADHSTEPIGPGALEEKIKVTSGTQGVATGTPEYILVLDVSLKLRDELVKRGYEVLMTRETHDVNISNIDRAKVANESNSDIYLRIHANGMDDRDVNGIMTICQTPENPFNAYHQEESCFLSEVVLDEMVNATGAKKLYVWQTDIMAGNNWSEVPVTIIEMGFMSNPDEDLKMATPEYQELIVNGISNGVDRYFER